MKVLSYVRSREYCFDELWNYIPKRWVQNLTKQSVSDFCLCGSLKRMLLSFSDYRMLWLNQPYSLRGENYCQVS